MIADMIQIGFGTAAYLGMGAVIVHGGIVSARDRKRARSESQPSGTSGVILRAGEVPWSSDDVRGIEWSSSDDDDTVSEWLQTLRQPTLF